MADAKANGLPAPPIPAAVYENEFSLGKLVGSAQDVVRQHLTAFDSIASLHEKNRSLLRAIRELTVKTEAMERKRIQDVSEKEQHLVEEAARTVKELTDELKRERARYYI